jgi:hypothetical protein
VKIRDSKRETRLSEIEIFDATGFSRFFQIVIRIRIGFCASGCLGPDLRQDRQEIPFESSFPGALGILGDLGA